MPPTDRPGGSGAAAAAVAPADAGIRARLRGWAIAAIGGCLLALAVVASPTAVPAQSPPASSPLHAGHWAYDALDRLSAGGVLDTLWLPGTRPRSQTAVAAALLAANRRAGSDSIVSPLAAFAESALARFAAEYPRVVAVADRTDDVYRPDSIRGFALRDGAVATDVRAAGGGFDSGRALGIRPRLAAAATRHLAVFYEPELRVGSGDAASPTLTTARGGLTGKIGPVWLHAGRERLGFGPGAGGGIVLDDGASWDGVMAGLDQSVRLPLVSRYLGPVHALGLLSRIGPDSIGGRAWFGAMRFVAAPTSWIQIGVSRSLLVATEVRGGERIGLRDWLYALGGKHTPFEDQLLAVDVRGEFGIGGTPLAAYLEWGMEDTAGGWVEDPGLLLGLFAPVLPGLPAASLRYEYAAFGDDAHICGFCGRQSRHWYRHGPDPRPLYATADGVPLAHPLGGYGHEHRLGMRVWARGGRLRGRATLLAREREPANILYDRWPGGSIGGVLGAAYRIVPAIEVAGSLRLETGDGWTRRAGSVGAHAFF